LSAQARTAVWGAALAGPLLFVPLFVRPLAAFALLAVVAVVALASVSVAYPVALAGLPALVVGLTGSNPFPKGGITLLLFLWTVLAVAFAIARDRLSVPLRALRSPVVVLSLLLLVWLVVRLPGSPDGAYGSQKLQLFLFVNGASLLAGVVIARRPRDFALFLQLMLAMSVASGFVLARQVASGTAQQFSSDRFVIASTYDPIQIARAMGLGLLIALALVLGGARAWQRTVALLATPLLTVAFFAAGSRGPLLGLIAGALVLGALSLHSAEARRRLLLIVPVGLLAAFVVGRVVPGQSITRVLSFLSGSDTQGEDRITLWHEAWHVAGDHPVFGLGTGGFGSLSDLYNYPHNIVLEVAAELGVVGVILLGAIVWTGAAQAYRAWRASDRRVEAGFALALLAYALLNAMFSGDISGNGQIWLAVGLGGGLGSRLPRRRREAESGEQPAPARTPARSDESSPGAVVAPADGEAVGGVVRVVATPGRTGWGVASVRIQVSPDGETWSDVPAGDEAYDVVVRSEDDVRQVAVVRTRRLADALAAVLHGVAQVDVLPARSRPWAQSRRAEAEWDTAGLGGRYRVRVVTSDLAGATVASPSVGVVVDNAPPTVRLSSVDPGLRAEAFDDGSGVASVRFEAWGEDGWQALGTALVPPFVLHEVELRHGDVVRAVAADRAGNETAGEPVGIGIALDADTLAALAASDDAAPAAGEDAAPAVGLEARERALRATAEVAARRERRLTELERELTARAEARASALAAAGEELAQRVRHADAEAAERTSRIQEREAALEGALRVFEEDRARLAGREAEVGRAEALAVEQERRLAEREAALEGALRAFEEDRVRLAGREAEVGRAQALAVEQERLLAEREAAVESLREEAERLRERLVAAQADAAERLLQAGEREAALERRERALEDARARLAERERAEREPARREPERVAPAPSVPAPVVVPPAPEPVAVPAPEPVRRAATALVQLDELERLVRTQPDPDSFVQEEREVTLVSLRGFVEVDGTIPEQFRALVDDVFGPLLYGR
jgi:O-antigen ligase